MTKSRNERSLIAADEYDPEKDPLNPAIVEALRGSRLLSDSGVSETDRGEAGLTAADRQKMASLGTSDDFLSRMLDRFAAQLPPAPHPPAIDPDDTLLDGSLGSTLSEPGSGFCDADSKKGIDELMGSLQTFQNGRQLSWTSRFLIEKRLGQGGQGVVFLAKSLDEIPANMR